MIEEKRINEFKDLCDSWPVYRCNFDEVDKGIRERAIKGGEEIRKKNVRETKILTTPRMAGACMKQKAEYT